MLPAIGLGCPLISYLGYSDYDYWDFVPLFLGSDVANLPKQAPSVVTQWGCWNTYFVSIYIETMAHSLLLTDGRGAASIIGSSSLTNLSARDELGRWFLANIAYGPIALGDALLRAQRDAATQFPWMREDVLALNLLGDPALVAGGK